MPGDTLSRYLTPRELGDRLGIQPDTLRHWRMQRRGPPFVKVNRLIRYDERAVMEWIAEQNAGGAA